jgi:hypothetical protein
VIGNDRAAFAAHHRDYRIVGANLVFAHDAGDDDR